MTRPTFARWLQAVFTGGVIACAVPAVAGATDYCVAPNVSCDQAHTVQSVEAALSLADDATDADRILLGAATYTPPPGYGFEYNRSDAPVEIIGAGPGQTILTRPAGAKARLLTLYGGPGSLVRDLTIRLPENVVTGFTGLRTTSDARHIEVVDEAVQSGQRYGVELGGGGTLEDSTVVLHPAADSWGVLFFGGGATVHRSSLSANLGLYSYSGGTLERSRVTGAYAGMYAYHGTTNVVNSLIRYGTAGGPGIAARTQGASGDTFVNIDGATIIGPGLPFSVGVSAGTFSSPALSSEVSLTNSVIRGAAHALDARTAVGATGHASLTATYSDYDPSGNTTAENGSISEANVTNIGDAGFVDAGGGDYHLLAGSPLVDAGDPATAQGLDLDGNLLVADGDADGTARRDMGAYELPVPGGGQPADGQPAGGEAAGGQAPASGEPSSALALDMQAPLVTGFRAIPTLRGPRVRYRLNEAAGVTLKIQRAGAGSRTRYRTIGTLTRNGTTGVNATRLTGTLRTRAARPGRYRMRLTATDAAGNRSAPRTARYRVPTA